jgi:hypothetical protein
VKDFKQFLLRGNVVDLAVGIVIGVAFGAVVTALVADAGPNPRRGHPSTGVQEKAGVLSRQIGGDASAESRSGP